MDKEKKIMIGKRLKELININGMRAEDVQNVIDKEEIKEKLGLKESTLQTYLSDSRRPTLENIVALANLFNTSVDYLIGKTDYLLDTWDLEFLKELFQYNAEKIKEHLNNKFELNIDNEDIEYVILYGLLTYMIDTSLDKTYVDLTKEDQEYRNHLINLLIGIFLGSYQMQYKENFHIEEYQALLERIIRYCEGQYSFRDEIILDELENNDSISREEKIKLLKSYINMSIINSQKAMKMLDIVLQQQ
jgi:transcriptional regulator with XRE-family HTH domain